MKITIKFLTGFISLLLAGFVAAQAYPNRPVRVVIPYPPGGPTDIVARVLFQQIGRAHV